MDKIEKELEKYNYINLKINKMGISMAKEIFNVIISPDEAQEILNREIEADLVDYQRYEIGDDKFILISLYEKYYFKNDSTAGILFMDFGASKNFVSSIKKALKDHIVLD